MSTVLGTHRLSATPYSQQQHTSGLSQERSTASPMSNQKEHQYWEVTAPATETQSSSQPEPSAGGPHGVDYSPSQSLPQVPDSAPLPNGSHPSPSITSTYSSMMLPPLRMSYDPRNPEPSPLSSGHPQMYSLRPPPPNYSPNQMQPEFYYSYPLPCPPRPPAYSSHMPASSGSSSNGPSEIFTPVSANTNSYRFSYPGHGTIQPSLFSPWQGQDRQLPGAPGSNFGTSDQRKGSPGSSTATGERWDRPSPTQGGAASPLTERSTSVDEKDSKGISYTTDAEVKQTPQMKRQCFNCTSRNPPSWRKSVLHPGKILCNKCGIFERTHHRPRPPQNDDQKLRKASTLSNSIHRREAPTPLQNSRTEHSSAPPHSPFSGPQSTPMSASLTYPPMYGSPDPLLTPGGYFRRSATHQPTLESPERSPLSHSMISPNLSSSAGNSNAMSGGASRHYVYQHSASSPYAHAYASRRGYAQTARGMMSSPSMAAGAFSGSTGPVMTPTTGQSQLESQTLVLSEERQPLQGQEDSGSA
ncbi:hypothetical protein C359_03330 [Cryptococcus neoformans Bt120]|nr:hypothetical protein C360_04523 [Cryptococcus neoformans var. grubii Bt15]OXG41914.1 hypothetical protein C359_03330 [Cryptococcus neoformans var. grubii Bt120]